MNERYFLDIELTELLENFEFKNRKLWVYCPIRKGYETLDPNEYEFVSSILHQIKAKQIQDEQYIISLEEIENLFSGETVELTNNKNETIQTELSEEALDFIRDQHINSIYFDTDSVEPITYHFVSAYGDSEPLTLNQFVDRIIHRRYHSSKIDYKIKKGNTTSIGTLYESLLVKLTPIKLKEYLWEGGQRL